MSPLVDDPRRRDFLALVPDDLRSKMTMALLRPLRDGAGTPDAVYAAGLAALRARYGRWGREDPEVGVMLAALLQHRDTALRFIDWLSAWDALPRAEKERIKAERGEGYRREWLEGQPPTAKQCDYLRALGYTGEIRSKRHASELIDRLKQARAS